MNIQKILSTVVLVLAIEQISARVRPPRRQVIQHPAVLTRAPPMYRFHQPQTPKQTTTAEPPEVDDEPMSAQTTQYNNNFYNIGPTYGYDPYGHASYTQTTTGGGVSIEEEEMPARRNRNYNRNNSRNQRQRPVRRTTQAPTTPEPDDDLIGNGAQTGGHQAPGGSGMCFCSPLSTCPYGSLARGGACWNVLSFFTNIRFQRCCYPPSLARWLFH